MSQHDFNIANQGFPSFRSDLNDALGSLASNSSGSTAPSTTYAYQFWYDTANDLLKMRNGDNDAWITLAFFDQTADEWQVRSAGSVIQVVEATTTTTTSTTSGSYTDTTLEASITPSSASNKVLIMANLQAEIFGASGVDNIMSVRIYNGASTVTEIDRAAINQPGDTDVLVTVPISGLDSPSTTSSTTYKVQFRNRFPSIDRSIVAQSDPDCTSTITLMEIAG